MTDDLMRRMAASRPGHLDPDAPVDGPTRSRELARAMAGAREASRARRPARPLWGLGLVGAAAAALLVVTTTTGPGHARPDPANGSRPTTPGGATGTTLNAHAILLAAAAGADRQPATTGAWWHTVSLYRTYLRIAAPTGSYVVALREREEGWTPSAVRKQQWSRNQDLGAVPATQADRAAWQRAGSPPRIPARLPAPKGSRPKRLVVRMTPDAPQTSHQPLVDGDKVFWLGRNVTMKDLRGLPDSPQALKHWLLRSYDGHGTESDGEKMSSDNWLFEVSAGLITTMPVTPKVRGAAFRMLAGLHTVTAMTDGIDAQGRQGTVVAIDNRTRFGGVLQHRLIIDTAGGRALADETVVVTPGATTDGLPPGSTWASTAVLTAGWTDRSPR